MLHSFITLPEYVVRFAPSMLSEHAMMIVLQTQGVRTKADLIKVAEYLGYKDTAPLTKTLNTAAEDGFCILDGYKVDWTPLFDKCFQIAVGSAPPVVKAPPPKSKDMAGNAMYILAGDMRLAAPNYWQGTINGWAKQVLPSLTKEFSREDILGYCAYIESYYVATPTTTPVDKRGINPKDSNLPINIRKWIAAGRKAQYSSSKDFKGI